MNTDNKTTREKAIEYEWWGNLSKDELISIKEHYGIPTFLTPSMQEIKAIYNSEHKESVVDGLEDKLKRVFIQDAKDYAAVSVGGITANNPEKYKAFRDGQDAALKQFCALQKEQLSTLIEGYGEALEALKWIEMKSYQKDEWVEMMKINEKAKEAIQKGQSLLSNLKNK